MKLTKVSEAVYRLRSIWMLFALFSGLGLYAQDMNSSNEKDLSVQLEIIATNRGVVIPSVYLTDKTDLLSKEAETIKSSLVFNTNANEDLIQNYYYWHSGSWHQLFSETDPANHL